MFRTAPTYTSTHLSSRRYDLDWLRVIAFGLLILYHIGMFYVTWGFHVKSVHVSPAAEPYMMLLNPWRLSLLFLISGVALRFAFDKAPSKRGGYPRFTFMRTLQLIIPISFGIHFIVAPQSWLQLLENGEIHESFWAFFPHYIIGTSTKYSVHIPTWNHLWYVVYLMLYTLVLAPFAKPFSKFMQSSGAKMTRFFFESRFGVFWVIFLPALPHLIYRTLLDQHFPTTHDVVTDWANHAHSFTFLLTGFLLAKDKAFWAVMERGRFLFVGFALGLGLLLTVTWAHWDVIEKTEIFLWPARYGRVLYAWIAIAALLSLAQRFLNKPSPVLTYMTEAIFPWYILHQTLLIMAGYWLTRQGLSVGVEFAGVLLATVGGCFLIHELFIRRFNLIRPLFGLKLKKKEISLLPLPRVQNKTTLGRADA